MYKPGRPVASQPGVCVCVGGGGLNLDGWNTGADTGFPEGGGVKTFTSTPPLGHCLRVRSSALRKIEKHPHSWTFTSTGPLGHCPRDVIHIPRGGGDRSRSRTLCIGFQYRDKFGGGGDHPVTPPLDPPLEHYIYRVWLGCLIMAETRSLAPIAVDG